MVKIIKNFKKELVYFSLIGLISVKIDFLIYIILNYLRFELYLSKALGFLGGSIFSYIFNKQITFKITKNSYKSIFSFYIVYIMALFINVSINNLIYNSYIENKYIYQVSFLISTFFSAMFNFLGIKFFVFKR